MNPELGLSEPAHEHYETPDKQNKTTLNAKN